MWLTTKIPIFTTNWSLQYHCQRGSNWYLSCGRDVLFERFCTCFDCKFSQLFFNKRFFGFRTPFFRWVRVNKMKNADIFARNTECGWILDQIFFLSFSRDLWRMGNLRSKSIENEKSHVLARNPSNWWLLVGKYPYWTAVFTKRSQSTAIESFSFDNTCVNGMRGVT